MNKRGLSDIVATILIVLLALAAVGIVAGFLLPIIRDSSTTATLSTKCLESEVTIVSCNFNSTSNDTRVLVRLAKGEDVSDVVVAVDFADESTDTARTGDINVFATGSVWFNQTTGNAALSARAYPVVTDSESGAEHTCENSPVTDCTLVS